MNASQLFADIATNCLTEVPQAAYVFDCSVSGLRVRKSFYVYPDATIVMLTAVDGGYEITELTEENESAFRHLNPEFFYAN